MGRKALATVALAVTVTGTACAGGSGDTSSSDRLQAVVSFFPLATAVERVGGDAVAVANLTPAGAEPHDLELAPRQVDAVLDADVVVVMGRGFQPAIEEVAALRSGATVEVLGALGVDAGGDDAEHDQGQGGAEGPRDGDGRAGEGDDEHGHEAASDPHVWLDPTLMAGIVREVAAVLSHVAPDAADDFGANARAFVGELEALHARYEQTLADCERDTIVVQHEAFGWLAARYGLRQEGIAGLSPESEPSPRRLAELSELVEREGITTVFTERRASARVAETLAREAGVDVAVLDPLEGLTEGQRADGHDYLSVMEDNLRALAAALGCG